MGVTPILLVAGRVKVPDRAGHHDYLAGCRLLGRLLEQTPGVQATVVRDGWPASDDAFRGARAVVFYSAGGGSQPFLLTPEREARVQSLAAEGAGLALLHQAVDFPADRAEAAADWFGGATLRKVSKRGHWTASHTRFPAHPATRGVTPWSARDGWICDARFAEGRGVVTPLLWARPTREPEDVVAWAYERPGGGRSFCFSGLDAHSAWSLVGLRQLLVNAVLWSAGLEVPGSGAPCAADARALAEGLTPRGSLAQRAAKLLGKPFRRLAKRRVRASP